MDTQPQPAMRITLYHIGFTGTRRGMTPQQKAVFTSIIRSVAEHWPEISFHHGDCVGADAEAHAIVAQLETPKVKIMIHPPEDPKGRAFCTPASEIWVPKEYKARNQDIVDCSSVMIATPKGHTMEWRGSGTWHAIRYALRQNKQVVIIYPDGLTKGDPPWQRTPNGRQ